MNRADKTCQLLDSDSIIEQHQLYRTTTIQLVDLVAAKELGGTGRTHGWRFSRRIRDEGHGLRTLAAGSSASPPSSHA